MILNKLIKYIKDWVSDKFTGVVTIHFHEGGIRDVEKREKVK